MSNSSVVSDLSSLLNIQPRNGILLRNGVLELMLCSVFL